MVEQGGMKSLEGVQALASRHCALTETCPWTDAGSPSLCTFMSYSPGYMCLTFPLSLSDPTPAETPRGKPQISTSSSQAPLLRWVLTLSFLMATVAVAIYAM